MPADGAHAEDADSAKSADSADSADGSGPGRFGSVREALRAARAAADYLNSPAARDLDGAACGEALAELGAVMSGLAAARRFDAESARAGVG